MLLQEFSWRFQGDFKDRQVVSNYQHAASLVPSHGFSSWCPGDLWEQRRGLRSPGTRISHTPAILGYHRANVQQVETREQILTRKSQFREGSSVVGRRRSSHRFLGHLTPQEWCLLGLSSTLYRHPYPLHPNASPCCLHAP